MIQISDLHVSYREGGFTLRIPSLQLASGERAALVGPSGSGKSTLLNVVAGIIRPDQGRVVLADTSLESLSEAGRRRFRAARVGLVFQDFQLLDYLNVRENILLPYILHPSSAHHETRLQRLDSLSQAVGLSNKLNRRPQALSHGERQRVALCRALITRPDIVLADEPTASLDAQTAGITIELLLRDARDRGSTLLTVTHDAQTAAKFDRVISLGDMVPADKDDLTMRAAGAD